MSNPSFEALRLRADKKLYRLDLKKCYSAGIGMSREGKAGVA